MKLPNCSQTSLVHHTTSDPSLLPQFISDFKITDGASGFSLKDTVTESFIERTGIECCEQTEHKTRNLIKFLFWLDATKKWHGMLPTLSQLSMHRLWYLWQQGKNRRFSPPVNCSRQITHSVSSVTAALEWPITDCWWAEL